MIYLELKTIIMGLEIQELEENGKDYEYRSNWSMMPSTSLKSHGANEI